MTSSSAVERAAPDPSALRFGIEAEFALLDSAGCWCDFRVLTWRRVQRIVERLDDAGHPMLVRGDLGIKAGRWYVEGDERFDGAGSFVDCVPKGLETRTPPLAGIEATVDALQAQTAALARAAAAEGHHLTSIGWNPFATAYRPDPPYNAWELTMRARHPEYTAPDVYMLSYGPDLNLSHPAWSDADAVDIARLLTATSPILAPFAFSAPFVNGGRAPELSRRTALRTGRRPAVRVFVDPAAVPSGQPPPPLVHAARIPSERGRVEFKAFDAVTEPGLYPALLALLAGLALSRPAWPRADVPDQARHATAARRGFDDPSIAACAQEALRCARSALRATGWCRLLDPLHTALRARRTPAHAMIDAYNQAGAVTPPAVRPG